MDNYSLHSLQINGYEIITQMYECQLLVETIESKCNESKFVFFSFIKQITNLVNSDDRCHNRRVMNESNCSVIYTITPVLKIKQFANQLTSISRLVKYPSLVVFLLNYILSFHRFLDK